AVLILWRQRRGSTSLIFGDAASEVWLGHPAAPTSRGAQLVKFSQYLVECHGNVTCHSRPDWIVKTIHFTPSFSGASQHRRGSGHLQPCPAGSAHLHSRRTWGEGPLARQPRRGLRRRTDRRAELLHFSAVAGRL